MLSPELIGGIGGFLGGVVGCIGSMVALGKLIVRGFVAELRNSLRSDFVPRELADERHAESNRRFAHLEEKVL